MIMDINELSSKIIGAAIEIHKALGSGLLESTYEECPGNQIDSPLPCSGLGLLSL